MKSIKTLLLIAALSISTGIFSRTNLPAWMQNKTAHKIGAALGATYLGACVANIFVDASYGPLLDEPADFYKQQPQTIDEAQELFAMAVQEDFALMAGNMQDWYLEAHLNDMNNNELRMNSRVGSIRLASAKKIKKDKKTAFEITWATIPGLSEQQIQELNTLQYQYVKEFSRAIRPRKKTYEVTTIKKDVFGKKAGVYYHALTMKQKRKVQEMHMRRAASFVQRIMTILGAVE